MDYRCYYFSRWYCYFNYLLSLANQGKEYNHAVLQEAIKRIQDSWPEKKGLETPIQHQDIITVCKTINGMLRDKFNNIKTDN